MSNMKLRKKTIFWSYEVVIEPSLVDTLKMVHAHVQVLGQLFQTTKCQLCTEVIGRQYSFSWSKKVHNHRAALPFLQSIRSFTCTHNTEVPYPVSYLLYTPEIISMCLLHDFWCHPGKRTCMFLSKFKLPYCFHITLENSQNEKEKQNRITSKVCLWMFFWHALRPLDQTYTLMCQNRPILLNHLNQ